MGRLKVFTNGQFDGYSQVDIDYLHKNFKRMIERQPSLRGNLGVDLGRITGVKEINNGYIVYTDKNNKIKYVEEQNNESPNV